MNRVGGEEGFALVAALVVLAVVDAVLAGLMFAALQDQRLGRASVRQLQALATAETAALQPVTVRGAAGYQDLAVGGTVQAQGGTATGWFRSQVRRLSPVLYLSQADGFSWDGSARQRVAMVLRLRPVPVETVAALKVLESPPRGALPEASGADWMPAGWTDCPPPGPGRRPIAVAREVSFEPAGPLGAPRVRHSRCAVSRALTQAAALVPLAERGWAELY